MSRLAKKKNYSASVESYACACASKAPCSCLFCSCTCTCKTGGPSAEFVYDTTYDNASLSKSIASLNISPDTKSQNNSM